MTQSEGESAGSGYSQDAQYWPQRPDGQAEEKYADLLSAAQIEVRQKRAEHEMENDKAVREAMIAERKAKAEADRTLWKTYYDSVFEVAKGSLDRARASAELVQKAASAIVTLYAGVLALTFSVGDNPLPWRGILPAFFLGFAVVLSTGFLAYLPSKAQESEREEDEAADGNPARAEGLLGDRLAAEFICWSKQPAIKRSRWLRASVISLGVALFFLPAAFINLGGTDRPSEPVAWPALAPNAPADVELQKIVYAAQVAEVTKQREAPEQTTDRDWIWALLAGLGFLGVVIVPRFDLDRPTKKKPNGGTQKPPHGPGSLPEPLLEPERLPETLPEPLAPSP